MAGMPVCVEFHNTGDATMRSEVQAVIEHVLSDRPGEWRVSIVGSCAREDWEIKIEGLNGFERSYTLVGGAGEHGPVVIGNLLLRLLPSKKS
jgi:precorrin-3B methylase